MPTLSTTRLSSKGQVVIPDEVRGRLGLKPGDRFVVVGQDDVVILKAIARPSIRQFDRLVRRARRQARAAGLRRSDVAKAVARVRGRR